MRTFLAIVAIFFSIFGNAEISHSYLATPYYDVDKYGELPTPDATGDTTDWYMCWAATLANMIIYTNWAVDYNGDGITDPYDVYLDYLDHFPDLGGSVNTGFGWYIDSHYSDLNWRDYWHDNVIDVPSMDRISHWLELGYGVNVALAGHAATGWGYEVDPISGVFTHLYLADSDDIFWGLEGVQKYEISLMPDGYYYINDYLDIDGYDAMIFGAQALSQNPFATPIPSAGVLIISGLITLIGIRRRITR